MNKKKSSLLLLLLMFSFAMSAQNYPKAEGALRIMTYNSHYCKGSTDPGKINEENVERFASVIAMLKPDVIAIQELDSACVHRGSRFLLQDIAKATGLEYVPIYGSAAPFDHGTIGCGALIRKGIDIRNVDIMPLPGDESRVAITIDLGDFVFVSTHSDLNNSLRKEGTEMICNAVSKIQKPLFLAGDLNDSHLWGKSSSGFSVWLSKFDIISDTDGNTIPGRADRGALIDYVLLLKNKAAKKVKPVQTHIVRTIYLNNKPVETSEFSDHYPVFVDVKF